MGAMIERKAGIPCFQGATFILNIHNTFIKFLLFIIFLREAQVIKPEDSFLLCFLFSILGFTFLHPTIGEKNKRNKTVRQS